MRRLFVITWTSCLMLAAATTHADPLRVCATTPDLGSLVREVGGSDVSVTVFAKATEDPHFVEPRPSFVVNLRDADLLVVVGLDLEIGWLPPLVLAARNRAILAGGRGYLDASAAIDPDEVPTVAIDRSMGDVHPLGNPHYLTDPLKGLEVAALVREQVLNAELRGLRVVTGDLNEWFPGPVGWALRRELSGPRMRRTHPAPLPLFPLDRIYWDRALHPEGFRVHRVVFQRKLWAGADLRGKDRRRVRFVPLDPRFLGGVAAALPRSCSIRGM